MCQGEHPLTYADIPISVPSKYQSHNAPVPAPVLAPVLPKSSHLASGLPVDDGGVRLADEDGAGAVLLTHLHAVSDNRLKRRVTENNKTGLKAKISGPPRSKAKFIKRTTCGEDPFILIFGLRTSIIKNSQF